MDPSLEEIRERVRLFLMDTGGLVWDNESLDEAIRQALRDLQEVSPITLTLEGMDGAVATVLEMGMDSVIVRGAAVYGLQMRIIDRADTFELNQTGLDMANLVEKLKTQYLLDVQKIRTRQFQMSACVPYFTLPDPDGV